MSHDIVLKRRLPQSETSIIVWHFVRWSLENITMHSIVFIVFFNRKVRFTHAFGQQTLEASSMLEK